MLSGGLRKVRPEIQIHFSSPVEQEKREYKDTFPEDLPTMEDVKEKYGKVVWCKYTKCQFNEEVKGLQRTTGTLLNNLAYTPISEQEHIWKGVCTRDEIGVDFKAFFSPSGAKFSVPACFVAGTSKTGYMDFSKLLQTDGTPYGGSIESQSTEHGSVGYTH